MADAGLGTENDVHEHQVQGCRVVYFHDQATRRGRYSLTGPTRSLEDSFPVKDGS
jgi:hypothetical protein